MKKLYVAALLTAALFGCKSNEAPKVMGPIETAFSQIDPEVFQVGKRYFFYPEYSDRAGWDALLGEDKEKFIKAGELCLDYKWKVVRATDYLEFQRGGNRNIMQKPFFDNRSALSKLIYAELAEGRGRFIDQIINGLWHLSESASWVLSAHQVRQHSQRALPDFRDVIMDLGSQQTGEVVAFALHFFKEQFDAIDPVIYLTIQESIERNLFRPYLNPANRAAQSWLGYPAPETGTVSWWENWDPRNNWNIWCNSAVNWSALVCCQDRDELLAILRQGAESIDNWLDYITEDGACDEGPAYWGHAVGCLHYYLEYMNEATGGKFGCFDNPRFKKMFEYISHLCVSDEMVVNFSDGGPGLSHLLEIYSIGVDADMKEMRDFAIFINAVKKGREGFNVLDPGGVPHTYLRSKILAARFKEDADKALSAAGGDFELMKRQLRSDVPAVNWYPETQHFLAKCGDWFFAAKGGHNAESHNHNDVGTVSLYWNGIPLLCDVGNSTYVRQTFNPKERYTIWSMTSNYHNLPMINGVPEKDGKRYAATGTSADINALTFHTDIAGAYPAEAAVKSWTRDATINENGLTIADKFTLSERKAADVEVFMARGKVSKLAPGRIRIDSYRLDRKASVSVILSYPAELLEAELENCPLTDPRQTGNWKDDHFTRILLKSRTDAPLTGCYDFSVTLFK